jgi:hypothetical protein
VGEAMAASALAIMFGIGFVAGRSSVRRVVVQGNGNQVIVVPPGHGLTIRNQPYEQPEPRP